MILLRPSNLERGFGSKYSLALETHLPTVSQDIRIYSDIADLLNDLAIQATVKSKSLVNPLL